MEMVRSRSLPVSVSRSPSSSARTPDKPGIPPRPLTARPAMPRASTTETEVTATARMGTATGKTKIAVLMAGNKRPVSVFRLAMQQVLPVVVLNPLAVTIRLDVPYS